MKNAIPFMSVRDVVLFPGNPMPLQIGRLFTIASIKKALKDFDGRMVVTAQRAIEMNDKPELKEVFSVGCICNIEESVEFPDGAMKILVKPQTRIKIKKLQDIEDIRFCMGEELSEFSDAGKISDEIRKKILGSLSVKLDDVNSERLNRYIDNLKREKDAYDFIMKTGHLLCMPKIARRELTVNQMNEGVFLIDTYSEHEKASINLGLARIQEILEANDCKSALRKIEALLE